MAHPLIPDPRETAFRVADEHVARTWVGKSAKGRNRERDRLAAQLLPVCEAVAEAFTPLAEKVAGLDGQGGITAQIRQIYDQDQARRAEIEARLWPGREGRAS